MTDTSADLAEWLDRHGLGQYAQVFLENNIEFSILPDLTEDDLEKLGVTLGHRKKLLRAIEALTAEQPPVASTTPDSTCAGIAFCSFATTRSRVSSHHGNILRPGGIDAAVAELAPRGSAKTHRRVSGRVQHGDWSLWRRGCTLFRRWRHGIFRLAARA